MKKLLNYLIFSMLTTSVMAQSDVIYTHFMFNKLAYNPAYAGSRGAFDLSGIYRQQWAGIDGAPQTGTFNVHTPFAGGRNAAGLSLTSDQIGKVNTNALDLYYAYHLQLNGKGKLSLGLQGRIEQARIAWSEAKPLDLDDEQIPVGDESVFAPNFGVGAYYYTDKYFAGFSVPRLLRNALYLDQSDRSIDRNGIRTYYMMGGANIRLGMKTQLVPSFLVSYNPNAPVDIDLNANLRFLDAFWVGASYRLSDSFDAMVGYEFKNGLRLGMAVDYTTSELQKATTGGYEVLLGYTFKCKDCNVSHLRFF